MQSKKNLVLPQWKLLPMFNRKNMRKSERLHFVIPIKNFIIQLCSVYQVEEMRMENNILVTIFQCHLLTPKRKRRQSPSNTKMEKRIGFLLTIKKSINRPSCWQKNKNLYESKLFTKSQCLNHLQGPPRPLNTKSPKTTLSLFLSNLKNSKNYCVCNLTKLTLTSAQIHHLTVLVFLTCGTNLLQSKLMSKLQDNTSILLGRIGNIISQKDEINVHPLLFGS
ncbi:hypothetical protein NAEGRDRAFT_78719, partial [Naegleria gruberi]